MDAVFPSRFRERLLIQLWNRHGKPLRAKRLLWETFSKFGSEDSPQKISLNDAVIALQALDLPVAEQLLSVPAFSKGGEIDFAKLILYILTGNVETFNSCQTPRTRKSLKFRIPSLLEEETRRRVLEERICQRRAIREASLRQKGRDPESDLSALLELAQLEKLANAERKKLEHDLKMAKIKRLELEERISRRRKIREAEIRRKGLDPVAIYQVETNLAELEIQEQNEKNALEVEVQLQRQELEDIILQRRQDHEAELLRSGINPLIFEELQAETTEIEVPESADVNILEEEDVQFEKEQLENLEELKISEAQEKEDLEAEIQAVKEQLAELKPSEVEEREIFEAELKARRQVLERRVRHKRQIREAALRKKGIDPVVLTVAKVRLEELEALEKNEREALEAQLKTRRQELEGRIRHKRQIREAQLRKKGIDPVAAIEAKVQLDELEERENVERAELEAELKAMWDREEYAVWYKQQRTLYMAFTHWQYYFRYFSPTHGVAVKHWKWRARQAAFKILKHQCYHEALLHHNHISGTSMPHYHWWSLQSAFCTIATRFRRKRMFRQLTLRTSIPHYRWWNLQSAFRKIATPFLKKKMVRQIMLRYYHRSFVHVFKYWKILARCYSARIDLQYEALMELKFKMALRRATYKLWAEMAMQLDRGYWASRVIQKNYIIHRERRHIKTYIIIRCWLWYHLKPRLREMRRKTEAYRMELEKSACSRAVSRADKFLQSYLETEEGSLKFDQFMKEMQPKGSRINLLSLLGNNERAKNLQVLVEHLHAEFGRIAMQNFRHSQPPRYFCETCDEVFFFEKDNVVHFRRQACALMSANYSKVEWSILLPVIKEACQSLKLIFLDYSDIVA